MLAEPELSHRSQPSALTQRIAMRAIRGVFDCIMPSLSWSGAGRSLMLAPYLVYKYRITVYLSHMDAYLL
jgi:hypothetical protein